MIVYLPILTLQGTEGKLFRPMALTVLFALVGSLILSLTLIPALSATFLPRRAHQREPWAVRLCQWIYRPILLGALRAPRAGARSGRLRAGIRRRAGQPAGNRVHSPAERTRPGDCHPAAGRRFAGRIEPLRHANRKAAVGQVSRRDRSHLDPHRPGRNRHRSDGLGSKRRVHHAQAAFRLATGPRTRTSWPPRCKRFWKICPACSCCSPSRSNSGSTK